MCTSSGLSQTFSEPGTYLMHFHRMHFRLYRPLSFGACSRCRLGHCTPDQGVGENATNEQAPNAELQATMALLAELNEAAC